MKEQLKAMKESLMACAQAQMGNLEQVDAKELGEVVDMIKDLCEACYYTEITESMEEAKKEDEILSKIDQADSSRFYGGRMTPVYRGGRRGYGKDYYPTVYDPNNDYYRNKDRMYYDGNGSNSMNGSRTYRPMSESRYERGRRMYSESKMMHPSDTQEDKAANMASLEEYLKGLSEDVTELVGTMDASEKAAVKQRIQNLATKIV